MNRLIDRALEWAKRLERRFYQKAYEDLRLEAEWMRAAPPGAQLQVRSVVEALPEKPNLLIFKPDEIGDAVYALPAIQEIRKAFPQAHLSLICQPKSAPVYDRSGLFDEIACWQPRLFLKRWPVDGLNPILDHLTPETFDAAIFLRTYPMYFGAFTRLPAKLLVHPRDPRMRSLSPVQPHVDLWTGQRVHQALQMLQIVSPLTGKAYQSSDVKFPTPHWSQEDKAVMAKVFPSGEPISYLVIHPFANFETRRYPMPYWEKVIEGLRKLYKDPIVVVGAASDPQIDLGRGIVQTQGKLTLMQTAYLISRASAFIGNESGPAHLSAMLGTPTATLMSGHSIPAEWAPWGDTLLLKVKVACSPCHLRSCHVHALKCLTELTPDWVIPRLETFLAKAFKSEATSVSHHPAEASSASPELHT